MKLKTADAMIEVNAQGVRASSRFADSAYLGLDHHLYGLFIGNEVVRSALIDSGVTETAILENMALRAGVSLDAAVDDADALSSIGIDLGAITQAAEGTGLGPLSIERGAMLTPMANKAQSLAELQAERLGASSVDPAHHLLAIAWLDPDLLLEVGVRSIRDLRSWLVRILDVNAGLAEAFEAQWDHSDAVARARIEEARATFGTEWVPEDELGARTHELLMGGGHMALGSVAHLETFRGSAIAADYDVLDLAGPTAEKFWIIVHPPAKQVMVARALFSSDGRMRGIGYQHLSFPPWFDEHDTPSFPLVDPADLG